jgi:DNA-binding XRE family transcriptional regulator
LNKKTKTLDEFIDQYYGEVGTPKRDTFEEGYKSFEMGFLIQEGRLKKGLTQAQLAEKVGTTKSYISQIENNLKEARISTLKKIIEVGLGGKFEINVKF